MTTDVLPDALRLAALLASGKQLSFIHHADAAAELRRLHAENLLLHERHAGDNQILQDIETQRDELLEALMRIDSMCEKPIRYSSIAVQEFARAAIAKATGE